jgi:hypothetical protein
MTDPIANLKTYRVLRGPEDRPTWSAQVIEQAHRFGLRSILNRPPKMLSDCRNLTTLNRLLNQRRPKSRPITKMTVYMHRLNLHETREKNVDSLTTFIKQMLDEKIRDRVRDTTMSSLGHGFITPTQYYHAV